MGKHHSKTGSKPKRASAGPAQHAAPPLPRRASKAAKTGKGSKAAQKKAEAETEAERQRRLGLRGAAPWAARHAAKHAAEARARNAEPPRPGSARATLRTPDEADSIKARVGELHTALVKIRGLRKNLAANFYEIGKILTRIQDDKLYDAKGFASFEAFVEREIDLGKITSMKLVRIPCLFREQATEYGLEVLIAALNAIDEAVGGSSPPPAPGSARQRLPMKPPRSGGRS